MSGVPERDWKLLRELKPVALARFCEKVLDGAAKIAATSGATSHQRYLKLYQMIQNQDRELAIAFDDHRRSTALPKIAQMHSRGLFTEEEFARFTDETRQHVLALESIWPRLTSRSIERRHRTHVAIGASGGRCR